MRFSIAIVFLIVYVIDVKKWKFAYTPITQLVYYITFKTIISFTCFI